MALVELKVPQLSLSGNQIRSIPDRLLEDQAFWSLGLSHNPITTLPETLGSLNDLYRLRLGYTGLSSLPDWMMDASVVAATDTFEKVVDVKLGGSPVCARRSATTRSFVLDCTTDPKENWPLVYPLQEEDALRATRLASLRQVVG